MAAGVRQPHTLSAAELFAALDSSATGLTSAEAASRLEQHGRNALPPAKQKSALMRFLAQFNNVLIYILLIAGIIKAIYQDWIDFWVIVAVAIGNAIIGFVQEGHAEKALAGIRTMLSLQATVMRGGHWTTVEAEELVPGDLIRLEPGDKVPADIRLIRATQLTIDESMLTGESVPASKALASLPEDTGVGDRANMAHSGTVITHGTAEGIVTSTGADTELGRIQTLVDDVEKVQTPLTAQLNKLGTQFALGILAASGIMLLLGRVVHNIAPESLLSSIISFAVAAVPEGLPALVTVTLALGVQQMAKRNAITREMGAVETLGAVTIVCSDKTGTLTRNEMTVRTVSAANIRSEVTGDGYARRGEILEADPVALTALAEVVGVCNDADLTAQDDEWRIIGEPTEAALAVFARKAGVDPVHYARRAALPFDSVRKFMAVLAEAEEGERMVFVKGAPDVLFSRCTSALGPDGTSIPFDEDAAQRSMEDFAAQGMRVLAAARRPAAPDEKRLSVKSIGNDLEFVGLTGLVDPPRAEAISAIRSCLDAGVAVKMITGDHASTAASIARQLGLASDREPQVATGAEISSWTRTQLIERVEQIDVFARTSPEHKIRIVNALQAHQNVVAMTGDGVNDAPALTQADVGIAMGIKGTEATKEAADIVLADDNFVTIERAIAEGRRIYDNIRKSVVFLLPTTLAQGLVVLLAVLFGFAPPLEPTQILWVNLVTAVTLSLALAYEPAEDGIMARPPRSRTSPILPFWLWIRVGWISAIIGGATIGGYFAMSGVGADADTARTTAVAILVIAQIFVLFSARFLFSSSLHPRALIGNRAVWISTLTLIALQLLFTYAPFMNTWFSTAPLGWREWGLAFGVGFGIFLLIEGQKALQSSLRGRA